jgi:hypothetical protein
MIVKLVAKGTRPLLMSNVRMASPMDPYAKELARLNKQKASSKRTDEDRLEIARVEWEGGLYFDEELGPCVPASWIFKTILEAARLGRRGPKIENGIAVVDMMHPLIYRGPRDLEGLWGDGGSSGHVDIRSVRVSQARVDRCRPIFKTWAFEADLLVDPNIIDVAELREIAILAGRLKGIGDYRQQFGRFEAEIEASS